MSHVLTLDQLNDLVWEITKDITELDPENVRISYQRDGQPAWEPETDVVIINVTQIDNPYDKQRNFIYDDNYTDYAELSTSYTRVLAALWTIYGPNGFTIADTIRYAILKESIRNRFSAEKIYPVTNIPSPVRLPELFNGRWYQRNDLTATFYAETIRTEEIPYLTGADIYVVKENGEERLIQVREP